MIECFYRLSIYHSDSVWALTQSGLVCPVSVDFLDYEFEYSSILLQYPHYYCGILVVMIS